MSKTILKKASYQRRHRRCQRVSRPASFILSFFGHRLRVEQLENRRMLAAVTVGSALDTVDDGDTKSITNLIATPGGDGIYTQSGTVTLTNSTVTANSTVRVGGGIAFDPLNNCSTDSLRRTAAENLRACLCRFSKNGRRNRGKRKLAVGGDAGTRLRVADGRGCLTLRINFRNITLT